MVLTIFSCAYLFIFLGEVSVDVFFTLVLIILSGFCLLYSFEKSSYILVTSLLSVKWFADILSQFVAFLLILLTWSYAEQNFLLW